MLADVVQQHRGRVLEIARMRLREMIGSDAAAQGEEYLAELMDEVIGDLATPQHDASRDARMEQTAAQRGSQRQENGMAINLVAHDFGVICDAISQLADETSTTVEASEWQLLNRAVDYGMSTALSAYEKHRVQREQDAHATWLGAIAHELRNALSAASTGLAMIKQGRVGTDSRTAELVTRNLSRAAILVNSLIAESRLEAAIQPSLAPVRLRAVIEDIVSSLTAARLGTLDIDAAPELTVMADEQLLISALTNLIQNAIKFSRPGGDVHVRARVDGADTLIDVEDACGGLPPGTAEQMFVPFVQQSTNRTGAGLGLTVARKVAVAHRGDIQVIDLPGAGCIFRLRLPR
jgi:signal transduction histidine kinase